MWPADLRKVLYAVATAVILVGVSCDVITSLGTTILTNTTILANSNQTLLSPGQKFVLGFYKGSRSGNAGAVYTLAIWYAGLPVQTVVWMADRSMNLGSNASLVFSKAGDLQIFNGTSETTSTPVWSTNTTSMNATKGSFLDTGNLELYSGTSATVWQSFDHPTDTLLPGQLFSSTANATMYSWRKAGQDWAPGLYALQFSSDNFYLQAAWPSPYIGWAPLGPDYWQVGVASTALAAVVLHSDGTFLMVTDSGQMTAIGRGSDFASSNNSQLLRRLTFDFDGNLRMYSWTVGSSNAWKVTWEAVPDRCLIYGVCGPFSICVNGNCECPFGFRSVDPSDGTQGCVRETAVSFCNSSATQAEVALNLADSVDFPNCGDYKYYTQVSPQFCQDSCLNSCFCVVATTGEISGVNGTGDCWLKKDTILNGHINNRRTSYMRIAKPPDRSTLSPQQKLIIECSTLGGTLLTLGLFSVVFGTIFVRQKLDQLRVVRLEKKWTAEGAHQIRFSYEELRIATRDFSDEIGRGGYGCVFKGQIGRLAMVAVKRLDKLSDDEKEFVNEVKVVGTIHHSNLVHLHGFCASGHHRLLVYEYLENSSLDKLLFRQERTHLPLLEWRSRFKIAVETARGLAYLHDDLRNQRIIHCDVKPENILLDSMLSAKVADFGLSRIMGKEQTRTITRHVRGTCGYLGPEWSSDCLAITAKTDVYSFGMVLLEIVSGRRNMQAPSNMSVTSDVKDAWYYPLWAFPTLESGTFLGVVDPLLKGIVNAAEVERVLQVAFLCINERPDARPSMSKVVQLLEGHVVIDRPIPRPNFLNDLYPPLCTPTHNSRKHHRDHAPFSPVSSKPANSSPSTLRSSPVSQPLTPISTDHGKNVFIGVLVGDHHHHMTT